MHVLHLIILKAYCLLGVGDMADTFMQKYFLVLPKITDGKIWILMGSFFVNSQYSSDAIGH